MHAKHNIQKNACANCPPNDEPMRFETCRRRQKCNKALILKVLNLLVYVV